MGGSAGGREVPAERDAAGTQGRESPEPSDGAERGGGKLQQERPVGDTCTSHTGRPGHWRAPGGRGGPQTHLSHPPPCPQGAPSLRGPPGSPCCQPHRPPGAAPRGGPPPAGAASASSPCLPASCPSWGQEGTRGGVRPGRKEDKRAMSGVAEARPTLTQAWTRARPGLRGQGRGKVGKTSSPPGWRGPLTWSGAGAQAPARDTGP